jgi:hypothetical protein
MLINVIAVDMVTRAQVPETQEEVIKRRLREQARREDREATIIAEEAQRQQEIRENLAKKAEYEREAEERRERKKAKQPSKAVVIDIPIENLKAFYAIHDAKYHSDESEEENASEVESEGSNSFQD